MNHKFLESFQSAFQHPATTDLDDFTEMGNKFRSEPKLEEKLCESCYLDCAPLLARDMSEVEVSNRMSTVGRPGHAQCLKALIKTKAVVLQKNLRKRWRQEALNAAAEEGDLHRVELLIETGADVNGTDFDTLSFNSPLKCAAAYGQKETVEFLIKKGADVNGNYDETLPALLVALLEGKYDCVEVLMKAGANVNIACPFGMTALMLAAESGKCLDMLLKPGADVNA